LNKGKRFSLYWIDDGSDEATPGDFAPALFQLAGIRNGGMCCNTDNAFRSWNGSNRYGQVVGAILEGIKPV